MMHCDHFFKTFKPYFCFSAVINMEPCDCNSAKDFLHIYLQRTLHFIKTITVGAAISVTILLCSSKQQLCSFCRNSTTRVLKWHGKFFIYCFVDYRKIDTRVIQILLGEVWTA